jgi:hypothetical protein
MARSFLMMLTLAIAIAICPPASARADDGKDKAATVNAEPAQPKIRVILPALWEPATPQAATQATSPQRNAAR